LPFNRFGAQNIIRNGHTVGITQLRSSPDIRPDAGMDPTDQTDPTVTPFPQPLDGLDGG
jgi:hypothetical protein